MSLPARKKYAGDARRLLLAFDIGTTFSGISYSILDPGIVPEIRPVTRYPCQEHVGGDSKIPTVIYYDDNGNVCAIGAETLKEGIEQDAEENGWTKAWWFKLHLRPKSGPASLFTRAVDEELPPLPPNKTVIQLFSDYMKYLLDCAKQYISESHGEKVWASLHGDIMFVLTHPNGWGGPQQAQMREAAINAGLVPNTEQGRSRVSFVTEGEASLHFCLSSGLELDTSDQSGVLIVDCGGGTIDLTAYRKLPNHSFEEIAIPKCHFQGAAFVTIRAGKFFKDLLSDSRFVDDVDTLTQRFDRNTKHVFRKEDEPHHIQFGNHRDRDASLNIRGGRLTVSGRDVAKFFEPSIACIVEAIKIQKSAAHVPIRSVFLVGGFSASSWLYEKVRERVEPLGLTLWRPDSHVNKAVSNGAVSFYLDHAVTSRVSRHTYGLRGYDFYNSTDPEHRKRGRLVEIHSVIGEPVLWGGFFTILPKDTRIKATQEFRHTFCRQSTNRQSMNCLRETILAYTGTQKNPRWVDEDSANYTPTCTVQVDTSSLPVQMTESATGARYFEISFDIILLFGLTELKAQIAYRQNIICTKLASGSSSVSTIRWRFAAMIDPTIALSHFSTAYYGKAQTREWYLRIYTYDLARGIAGNVLFVCRRSERNDTAYYQVNRCSHLWSTSQHRKRLLTDPMAMFGFRDTKSDRERQQGAYPGRRSWQPSGQRRGGSRYTDRGSRRHDPSNDVESILQDPSSQIMDIDRAASEETIRSPSEHASTAYHQPNAQPGQYAQSPRPESHRDRFHMNREMQLLEASRVKDDEIATLRHQAQELQTAMRQMEEQLNHKDSELQAARERIDHQNQLLEGVHHQHSRGEDELKKLRTLLADRIEEVKVAQAFMTTADKYSVREVSQMMEELNDEIYQCAMDLSDAVLEQEVRLPQDSIHDEDTKERLEDSRYAFRRWNKQVIARLEVELDQQEPNALLLECMIETVLAARCLENIRVFCSQNEAIDDYICDLWEEIAASHETPIARNWLAMTQAALKVQGQLLPDRTLISRVIRALIVLSGRVSPPSTWLEDRFGAKLDELDAKSVRVKEALAEGVVSADLEAFAYPRDTPFNPAEMRDAMESGGSKSKPRKELAGCSDRIVCSVGLGIRQIRRELRSSNTSGARRKEVILKPKVLLYSTLNE
ncbi:hypothetical protein NMY22_g6268 [Coprinellus aureogranulatus]|nr:hypothetical protein NMY22_g6268 [Coprinellus aureogranulatus]